MFLQSAKSCTIFYVEYIGYVGFPLLTPYQGPECCFKAKIFSCLDRNMTIFPDFQGTRPRRDIGITRPRRDQDTQTRVTRPRHVSRHPALANVTKRMKTTALEYSLCICIAFFKLTLRLNQIFIVLAVLRQNVQLL